MINANHYTSHIETTVVFLSKLLVFKATKSALEMKLVQDVYT